MAGGGDDDCGRRPSTEDWDGKSASEYVCPRCCKNFQSGEFWIQCDACRDWFHGSCVYVREHESAEIEKFFCITCEHDHGLSIMKPITNDHRHDRTEEHADDKETQAGSPRFLKWLTGRRFPLLPDQLIQQLDDGRSLTLESLVQNGFRTPILIDEPSGLGLKLPHKELSITEVLNHFPADHVLDVIDSRRQLTIKLPAEDFVRLVTRATEHESVYNCISLEVSKSDLGRQISAPEVVTSMSWVDNDWPKDIADKPYVSKYCLMSMADSYTDFHIDFGGTSVWYHVLRGQKIFYVIEPTDENMSKYEEWMQLKNQSEVFFGDMVDHCYSLHLKEGNTLLIPTAWIHAVLTPSDSLVFGGNFLHSLNMKMQIRCHEMEQRMKTPAKFQFPFFELAHWYSVPTTLKLLHQCSCNNSDQSPPKDLLHGASALISALKRWSDAEQQQLLTPPDAAGGEEAKSLVPAGFNCRRAIKELSKAIKVLKKKKEKKKYESSATLTTAATMTDASSDSERELVMDEGAIEGIRQKVKDEERKGVIKMKLSLCGKSGLPEVTQVATGAPPDSARHRKKRSASLEEDPEIMDMIRDQPEDDDFIYLDVADDEDEIRTTTPDYAWSPRAKVVIHGAPKESRPVREHARREFVETCLANAAARMEQAISVKKVTAARRKSRGSSSSSTHKSSEEHLPASPPNSSSQASKEDKRKTSPTPPRARKGEKTAKQRLAKLMKIGKR